jgi:hypothetical protein
LARSAEATGQTAWLEVHVQDGEVELATADLLERGIDGIAIAADIMAERQDEILQHHGDEGLILDDQDRTVTRHISSK